MNNPLLRTTIVYMFPQHDKNKFKYCFEMRDYGGKQRDELETWCLRDSENRRWGNMGYVECQRDEDAIELILRWGINWRHTPKSLSQEIKQHFGVEG
jgi:hypothetical protein